MDLPCPWAFSSSKSVAGGGRRDLGRNGRRLICVANHISVLPGLSHKYQSELQCWAGGWLGGCHPGGDGAETLCSPAFWQGLGLLSVGMCLSCHVGQKGGAAAAKVLLLSRMVKELSVWPGRHAVWPWAGTGCPALDFGESGPCRELPHGLSPIVIASTEL